MADTKIKLGEITKKFKAVNKDVIAKLEEYGVTVKSSTSVIDDEVAALVADILTQSVEFTEAEVMELREEARANAQKEVEKAKAEASDNNFRGLIIEKATANMTVNVPAAMIDERVNRILDDYARNCAMQGMSLEQYFGMMGIDEQTFRGYVRPGAETDVKVELMLEKVAEVESLEITAEEIEAEYKKAAEMYNMDLEKLKEAVAEEYITHDLRLNKASKFLADNAVALDEPEDAPAAEAEAKPAAKKTTKKAAEKTEDGEAKPAAKKTTKKAAEKTENGEAKPAAKKTTAKKTAEKKTEE